MENEIHEHENTDNEIDEKDLYELDKFISDKKEWCKRLFGRKLKYINDIASGNDVPSYQK